MPTTPLPQGRVTLTPATPVAESDVVGAAAIYYVGGVGPDLSLMLDTAAHQAGKNYDLYTADDAGITRLVTGPSWDAGGGSDNARGVGAGSTELQSISGIPTNKNAMVGRWSGGTITVAPNQGICVGTFRATADGQATDSYARRLLFNVFNPTLRPMRVSDPLSSWLYASPDIRQANGNAANQLECLLGLAGIAVEAMVNSVVVGTYLAAIQVGIGLDSTTAFALGGLTGWASPTAGGESMTAAYRGVPGIGLHKLVWLETGGAGIRYYGVGGNIKSGIVGSFLG